MFRISIDGKEVSALPGQTLLEVARQNGIEIPTLCYDARLKPYGGCGLCVVEVGNRLCRACATEAAPGMVVLTGSERVRQSRKFTLELLLSDHNGDCRGPCFKACPAHIDVQGYLGLIANGEYREAVALIKEKLPLPASIGRVCPHPCEERCRRSLVDEPLSIAALKYFAADLDLKSGDPYRPEAAPPTGRQVAVVGAGPAGLTAAYFLARAGHRVVVYEAMPQAGGMLRYGIPEYRLPREVLDRELELIAAMGVRFVYNTRIGEEVSLDCLRSHYDAVFLGIGAWRSSGLRCEGEDLPGVLGGIDFLREVARHRSAGIGERVAVIGGGNTAIDAARTALRLGAGEVMVIYRRTRAEMPAEEQEIIEAEEEGVQFKYLAAPIEVCSRNGRVASLRLQKMRLGEPDASGRRRPLPVPGEVETIRVDTVIRAVGQEVDPAGLKGVALTGRGTIAADDETLATSLTGVFAGGDGVTGPGIAIAAIAQGRRAAESINSYLAGRRFTARAEYLVEQKGLTARDFADRRREARVIVPELAPAERRGSFREVRLGLDEAAARAEAGRCLECGCLDYFECKLIRYANEYRVEPERLSGNRRLKRVQESHPYLERNSEKCILCGQCLRVCGELVGAGALGLVNRGFESSVEPEFGRPLVDSECVGCGECVAVCPTGALVERYPVDKSFPVEAAATHSVCSFCGVGCSLVVNSRGSLVLRVLPGEGGALCRQGRFGFAAFSRHRLTRPLVRRGGKLEEASWAEAGEACAAALHRIKARRGGSSLGITLSPSSTLEEAAAWQEFGRFVLGTDRIGSFAPDAAAGLETLFGRNLPYSSFADLAAAELIIMVGSCNRCQVAAFRVREAVRKGASLVLLSPEPSLVDDLAGMCLTDVNASFLGEVVAALLEQDPAPAAAGRLEGFPDWQRQLSAITPGHQARELARLYSRAGRAVILADGHLVTAAGVQLLGLLSILAGKSGQPGSGLLVVTPGGNREGLRRLGLNLSGEQLEGLLKSGGLNGLFIFGEDPVGAGFPLAGELQRLELLVVVSPYLTATARLADLVLPGATPLETEGSYINSEGQVRRLKRVRQSPTGLDNLQILEQLGFSRGGKESGYGRPEPKLPGAAGEVRSRLLWPPDSDLFREVPVTDPACR